MDYEKAEYREAGQQQHVMQDNTESVNFRGFRSYMDKVLKPSVYNFNVYRVSNGFVFLDSTDPTEPTYNPDRAKYVPDIDGILREVARAIGGEDAVPIMPVSAVEAGLIDENQLDLGLGIGGSGGATTNSIAGTAYGYVATSAVYEGNNDLANTGSVSVEAGNGEPGADKETPENLGVRRNG